ncbi:hypothetical protein E2562_006504 [Oryza meyeriana var. granulata]|uniref:Uncharacterized protein n=1 Tax=Oryza meyeriana var. granulata TaxID=110450 RepID=A0A6G1CPZ5_9ORYZ|nr:hypothetical protein E2562_006504 [Oryza meyeriana var. granulata]
MERGRDHGLMEQNRMKRRWDHGLRYPAVALPPSTAACAAKQGRPSRGRLPAEPRCPSSASTRRPYAAVAAAVPARLQLRLLASSYTGPPSPPPLRRRAVVAAAAYCSSPTCAAPPARRSRRLLLLPYYGFGMGIASS